jgi:lipopolysaccharide/colanic/teichoic acid biosynthesis glycosyltransferase
MHRILNVLLAAVGILIVSPLMGIVALIVKLSDGGPVLYKARRVGKGGNTFVLYKFRTMVQDADSAGGGITTSGDSRITPVGRLLRKYKLDELPQLINILKGEMDLVGARPEDPRYVALYSDHQRQVLEHRPGITSPASLLYRNEEALLSGHTWHESYVQEILPRKVAIDLSYLSTRTLWGDMKIILKTLWGILREKPSQ